MMNVIREDIGDITASAVFRNLTERHPALTSAAQFKESFPKGFTVVAEIEKEVYETEAEEVAAIERQAELVGHDKRALLGTVVRFVLEPKP